MADIVDITTERTETLEAMRLRAVREASTVREVESTGFCLYCDAPVGMPRRWCDASCLKDWEEEKRHGKT